MANRRISEFPLIGGTAIDEPDLLTLVHVFEVDPVLRNKKITFSGFKDYLNQYYVPKASGTFDGNIAILGNLTVSGSTNVTTITGSNTATFSGLVVQAGTAAAPSVSVGTTDNGLYSPGADQLALTTSGTGRLFIDASGKIGIGSASTLAKFQVAGLSNYGMPAVEIEGVDAFYDITNNGSVSGLDATDASYGGIPLNTAIRNDTNTAGINFTNYGIQNHVIALDTGAGEFSIFSRDPSSRYSKVHITGSPERGLLFGIRGTDKFQFAHYSTSVDRAYESLLEISPTAVTSTFSGTERFRINSDGRLLIGTSSARAWTAGTITPHVQVEGSNANSSAISVLRTDASSTGARLLLGQLNGSMTVPENFTPGRIEFQAYDGSQLLCTALIASQVDDTPGANDMPGRLVFSTTADGASSPTERMRIDSTGFISFNGDTDTGFSNPSANTLALTTFGAERLKVTSGGNVYIGATNQPSNVYGGVQLSNPILSSSRFSAGAITTSVNQILFFNGNGIVGTINTNGSATAYNTSSDYRLKENVVPLTGAVDRLNQLQVHRFNFIADPATTLDGFIAHEAQAVVPECVTGTKDEVDEEGNPVYQGIDQSKIVPLVVAALQEALAEIETLKAEVATLKGS